MYENNHYVPQLLLRRFSENLCTYNVKTGEYINNQPTSNIFSKLKFYPVEIEKMFGQEIEGPFANILNKKILKATCPGTLELTRKEINIIKKFLLLEQMRVSVEENIDINQEKFLSRFLIEKGIQFPFTEKIIKDETSEDRWLRNIRVILECPKLNEIQNQEFCTYEAYRWAQIYNCGYLAFWDSGFDGTEFIISDVGMTSEVEESASICGYEKEKLDYLMQELNTAKSDYLKQIYFSLLAQQSNFHENFYMFSISKNRMIVIINPFFRMYDKIESLKIPDIWPTQIKDRKLFSKNKSPKINTVWGNPILNDMDKFVYKIHSMKHEDIIYVNELMLDRIDTYLGFTSLENIRESVYSYIGWYKSHGIPPRKNYDPLAYIIDKEK